MLPVEHTIVPHAIHDQDIVSFPPTATVREVVDGMAKCRIGAVLIMEGDKLRGIFTERDALMRVLAPGKVPETTPVSEVMTANPDTAKASDSVVSALAQMQKRGYRHLPVVDRDRIVGVVSIRDVYRSVKEQMDEDILLLAETLLQG